MKNLLKNSLFIIILATTSLISTQLYAHSCGCKHYRTSCCNVKYRCCPTTVYYRYYQPVTYRWVSNCGGCRTYYYTPCCGGQRYYYDYYGYRYYYNGGFYVY